MLGLEQQIFHQWKKAKNILIIFPANWDGDSVASSLALFLFLKKLGKDVDIAGFKETASHGPLSFLPAYANIQTDLSNLRRFIVSLNIGEAKVSQIKYAVDKDQLNFIISPASGWFKPEDVSTRAGEFKYDLIVTLGTTDLENLDRLYDDNIEFFYKTTIINIDHHSSNEDFGQINFVDLNAVATAEILFYLLKNNQPELIDEDIATCLLAGIIQKTKNFKTANLTPRILLTTSQLISLGARREEIINHLYRSRNINSLQLWGNILNNLRSEKNDELLWSKLSALNIKNLENIDDDLTEIVDELIVNVASAKIFVLLKELSSNKTEVSLYALKNANALELLKEFAPQGSPRLAQATLPQDIDTCSAELILDLRKKLDKLTS
ncbi:MAG: DHH family phosphoesterase [Candidatus Cloacimonetes bacterium]|jgi:phosphoesterase RecJ-like protein|nr:DHH family phosphoesterase [Candidatus Cloacimonadota bacterium]